MNLKSVHTKPAPKAMSKNIRLNHKIGDAASNEAKQLAYQYINEWCHNWAIRHSKLQNLDDIQIERVEDFIYWHLTRPRQDSVKNQKTGRVGQSYLDSFMDLITENNTNADTTWQQKLRAYISKFCNSCSKQVWNEALGASFNAEGSYDEYGSNATEGDMDIESSAAFEDKSGNFGDYETYGESEEENAPGADHSDRDFIEGFKRMSPEMQAALIKELGTGKNFTDPRMKRLYQQMRKYVKKGVDIEDSADIPAAIPANITRLAADLILWAIDNLDPDEQLYEWHYSKDRWDALKKWAETLYNNTEEIDESFDDGYDSEEVTDSAPSDAEVDALLKALNTDGANVTKEQLMKAYASFKKDAQVADSIDQSMVGVPTDDSYNEVSKLVKSVIYPSRFRSNSVDFNGSHYDLSWFSGENPKDPGNLRVKKDGQKVLDKNLNPWDAWVATLKAMGFIFKWKSNGYEFGLPEDFEDSVSDAQVADSKIVDEDAGPKQGLTPDQWPTEVEDPNTGEMKPVGDIKKADSKKLKKNDLITIIGAKRVKSKVKDSARQFKVYYLDENRKTRTLFVKAYDEDDALEVAAEKIPAGCEVHSAVDTNPLG